MPGFVFRAWSDVDHDDVASTQARRQLRPRDRLDVAPVTEVVAREPIDSRDMLGGDVADRAPQVRDSIAAQRVVHAGAFTPRGDEAGAGERLEMMRGVGDTLVELDRDVVDRAFSL